MSQIELLMPKMGESVAEATIIKWLKKEGDKIEIDEPVLEIATDKVDSEIPAIAEGTLVKQLFNEGDVVKVGTAIALIATNAAAQTSPNPVKSPAIAADKPKASPIASGTAPATVSKANDSGKFYSPLVRNIAQEEGISVAELEAIPGTGKDNRVTKTDIY